MEKLEKGEEMSIFKKEVEVEGSRVIVHRLSDGLNVEIVGGDDVDDVAQKIASSFGGDLENPDHPGASHIRLVKIEGEDNDVEKFVDKMKEEGLL